MTAVVVDRTDPTWERLRAACSDISAASIDLDEHADGVYRIVAAGRAATHFENHKGPGRSSLDGMSAAGARGDEV